MKKSLLLIFATLLIAGAIFAYIGKGKSGKPTVEAGHKYWSAPEKRLVRATIYQKGEAASDSYSKRGKSDGKLGLRYATAKEAGTLAVPNWLPRGSMVKIHTERGVLAYIAADEGSDVESRKAARESGKTKEQTAAPVLDFCASEQLWPDYIIVEIYQYAGKVPFDKLSIKDQKALFAYAMKYVTKRD